MVFLTFLDSNVKNVIDCLVFFSVSASVVEYSEFSQIPIAINYFRNENIKLRSTIYCVLYQPVSGDKVDN